MVVEILLAEQAVLADGEAVVAGEEDERVLREAISVEGADQRVTRLGESKATLAAALANLDWQHFTDDEFALCPPILAMGGDGANRWELTVTLKSGEPSGRLLKVTLPDGRRKLSEIKTWSTDPVKLIEAAEETKRRYSEIFGV